MRVNKYFSVAKQLGFEDIEFKSRTSKKLSISIFHEKVENYTVAENETLYIRGIVNGKMVSGQTENEKSIERILKEMVKNAELIEDNKPQEIFGGSEKYKNFKTHNNVLANTPVAEKINLCLAVEAKAKAYDARVSEAEVEYNETQSAMTIVNSKGLKLSYKSSYGVLVASVVAKDGDDTRTGFKYVIGQDMQALDPEVVVKEACDNALNALHGTQCDSGKYKVLLTPGVFSSLINILISNVSGDSVNKGRTLLKDKLNEVVASKKFTLTENPHSKAYPFFYRAFDDEGVATLITSPTLMSTPIIGSGICPRASLSFRPSIVSRKNLTLAMFSCVFSRSSFGALLRNFLFQSGPPKHSIIFSALSISAATSGEFTSSSPSR